MRISNTELHDLLIDAEVAFWHVIAERFPQAVTGDLSIDMSCRLRRIAQEAIEEWINNNVPEAKATGD